MFLNYKTQGNGKPMFLLHGLFGSLSNLGVLARAFNEKYCTYQIDLPNHGLSPHTDPMDYVSQAAWVKALIDKQKLENITLIGHSMGGKVAMMLALQYPQWIEKLVVLDIAPVSYPRQHDNIFAGLNLVNEKQVDSRDEAEKLLAQHITTPSVRQFLLMSLFKNDKNKIQWRFNLATLIAKYNDIIGWQSIDAIYQKEVLFLKGSESDYILPSHKKDIVRYFPHAKTKIIAKTAHWLHSEKPESVILSIDKFLHT